MMIRPLPQKDYLLFSSSQWIFIWKNTFVIIWNLSWNLITFLCLRDTDINSLRSFEHVSSYYHVQKYQSQSVWNSIYHWTRIHNRPTRNIHELYITLKVGIKLNQYKFKLFLWNSPVNDVVRFYIFRPCIFTEDDFIVFFLNQFIAHVILPKQTQWIGHCRRFLFVTFDSSTVHHFPGQLEQRTTHSADRQT